MRPPYRLLLPQGSSSIIPIAPETVPTSAQDERRLTHSCERRSSWVLYCTSKVLHLGPPSSTLTSGWWHEPGFETHVDAPTSVKYGQGVGARDLPSGGIGSGGQDTVCDISGQCPLSTDSSLFHFDTFIYRQSLRGILHQDHLFWWSPSTFLGWMNRPSQLGQRSQSHFLSSVCVVQDKSTVQLATCGCMRHAACGEFGSLIDQVLMARDRDNGSWHSMTRPHLAY